MTKTSFTTIRTDTWDDINACLVILHHVGQDELTIIRLEISEMYFCKVLKAFGGKIRQTNFC